MPTPSAPPNTDSSVRSKPIACSAISTPTTIITARTALPSTTRMLMSAVGSASSRCSSRPDTQSVATSVIAITASPLPTVSSDVCCLPSGRWTSSRMLSISGSTPTK